MREIEANTRKTRKEIKLQDKMRTRKRERERSQR